MLYNSDINSLLSQWESSLSNHTPDYKIAVRDCIYDLKTLMDRITDEEIASLNPGNYLLPQEELDTYLSQEADSCLSSMKDYGIIPT